jgi:DNA polymerase-3 subunit gamma/tau
MGSLAGMYRTALARSHRPRRFAELVGQDHVSSTLRAAVESGRVAHAYLFCGARGIGKTTAARVLAMALNCPDRSDGEPCGVCDSCDSIWAGRTTLDVVEIDAASNRGVDDARDLRERAMYAPSDESRYKVYIIDEAHMLTGVAWNALLKTIEEPPPRVIFVFATTEPEKIRQMAAPVLSRCQRFDFRRVSVADLVAHLRKVLEKEEVEAEESALLPIARRAEGGVRDALSLLDQVLSFSGERVEEDDVRRMLGLVAEEKYLELAQIVDNGDRAAVFPFVQELLDEGYDLGEFVRGLGEAWRVLLGLRMDPDGAASDLPESTRASFTSAAEGFPEEDLMRYLMETVDFEASGRFRRSLQPRIQLEALLLRLASMTSFVEFSDLITALETGEASTGEIAVNTVRATPQPKRTNPRPKRSVPVAKQSAPDTEREEPAVPPAKQKRALAEHQSPEPTLLPGDSEPPQAWHETIAALRGKGLGAEAIALSGAKVDGSGEGEVRVLVVPGLVEEVRAFIDDPIRSGTFRREFARRVGIRPEDLKFGVESAEKPERLTAAEAKRQRLERMMDADPNLRDAVQELDLELKE